MDLLNNTAVFPDRVDRFNLLGCRIFTQAVMHFTSLYFPIPFIVMHALLLPSQDYNSDPESCSGLPSPLSTTIFHLFFLARRTQHFLSLVNSRRFVSTHAARRLMNKANKAPNGGYLTEGPTLVL